MNIVGDDADAFIVWRDCYENGWEPQGCATLQEVFAYITGDIVAGRDFMITKLFPVKLVWDRTE